MTQATSSLSVTLPSDREIAMTRAFDAPRQLVFDAWTKPEHVRRWFGAVEGYTMPVCEIDLRAGGAWRWVMRGADGSEMEMYGEYREIAPPGRLVNTENFAGEFFEAMGGGSVNTMVLEEHGVRTTMTLTSLYKSKEARDAVLRTGWESGAGETLDRLAEILAGTREDGTPVTKTLPGGTAFTVRGARELLVERWFKAPRELVFAAWTECDRLMKWWGPREWPLSRCTIDLREGGVWHYCMRARADGQESWGKATYQRIARPSHLVFRDCFSNADGDEIPPFSRMSVSFSEHDGGTLITSVSTFDTPEQMRQVIAMGVMEGLGEALELLAEHLAESQR